MGAVELLVKAQNDHKSSHKHSEESRDVVTAPHRPSTFAGVLQSAPVGKREPEHERANPTLEPDLTGSRPVDPSPNIDAFDVTAPADTDAAANSIAENAAAGTKVGITALASDGDTTTNGVTYSLTDNAGGRFVIDAATGEVSVAAGASFDRESEPSVSLEVRAISADGSSATRSFTVQIADADEFDVTPVSDTNAAANAVTENAAIGTTVGITAFASDGDATNSGVTYSLTDDAGGRFAINSTTGVVTVAGAIDREAGATQAITVRATSADSSIATQSYTITVNDADEFDVTAPTDTDAAANSIAENAAAGRRSASPPSPRMATPPPMA